MDYITFMEPEGSLLCSQEPATGPYLESENLNIILPSMPMYSKWFLPFRFTNQNTVCISHLSMHITCPAHLFIDLITLTIYGEISSLLQYITKCLTTIFIK